MNRSLAALFLLASCGVAPAPAPYNITAAYDAAEAQPFSEAGNRTITGQAFLKTVGGDVKTCAGEQVILWPTTAYGSEMYAAALAGHSGNFANTDQRFKDAQRVTLCDAQGHFRIANLPAKKWFVLADANWGVPGVDGSVDNQGGVMWQEVDLTTGDADIIMTDRDLH